MVNTLKKFGMALGLVTAVNSSAVIPPVDLNRPVVNPALVAAMKKHQQIGSNETAQELMNSLKGAVFLVGMIKEVPTKAASGHVLFEKGEHIGLISVFDNQNNNLLGLFTDHEELQKFSNQANSTLVMPAKDALNFVLAKGYAGLVVNPSSPVTLHLDKKFIEQIIGEFK